MSEVHVFNIVVVFGLNMCSIKGKQLGLDCLRMGYENETLFTLNYVIIIVPVFLPTIYSDLI
jgi:hypothetical protein